MRKYQLIILACLLASQSLLAQGLTQNAEGQSSILFKGNSLSFDIGKTEIAFGMNNLDQIPSTKTKKANNYFIKGLSIKAGSEEGIGNLFSNGDLVPNSSLRVFAGLSFSNLVDENHNNRLDEIKKEKEKYQSKFEMNLIDTLLAIVEDETVIVIDSNIKKRVITELNEHIKIRIKSTKDFRTFLSKYVTNDATTALALREIIKRVKELEKEYETSKEKYDSLIELESKRSIENPYWKLLLFGYGGINAMSFKRFDSISITNPAGSFIDEDQRGGHFGIGFNYQRGRFKFGVIYDYFSTNNFNYLTKKEYTLRQTTTAGSQSLIQEKKVTAYAGKFGKVEINRLNIDVAVAFKIDKEANNYLLVNPYLRGNFYSRDTSLIPNTFNIGTGFYLFKKSGKFLGGIYVELPDVDNTIEKKKKPEDQNIRPAMKRLTLGIVAKMSLKSILSKQ